MKKKIFALLAWSVVFASFVACGSDDDSFDDDVSADEYVKSADDLETMKCTSKRNGMVVYLSEDNKRMVCYEGDWIDYFVWKSRYEKSVFTDKVDDTVSTYSALPYCNTSREKTVNYVKSMNLNLVCVSGEWLELSLQTLPDSVRSMNALPACLPSVTGAIIYLSSMKQRVICSEGEWVEYNLWLTSSGSTSSSSRYSSSSSYYSSSSSSFNIMESIFGKCTDKRDNEIVYDTNGVVDYYNASSYGYYYCDASYGSWRSPSVTMIDTVGWAAGSDGEFREGQFSYDSWSDYYDNLNSACAVNNSRLLYYVYDKGWRAATDMDVCLLYACTDARDGKTYKHAGYTFKCSDGVWTQDSLYSASKTDWTNPDITYGKLTDSRDGKVYKTVTIGGAVWMAQNLNYRDTVAMPNLIGGTSCALGDDASCSVGGRLYRWNAAVNLPSTYVSSSVSVDSLSAPRQGACPAGWHVPDTTEWKNLYQAAGTSTVALKAVDAWVFYSGSSYEAASPTNSLGFSALPVGYKSSSTNYGKNVTTIFCSLNQAGSSYAYAVGFYSGDKDWGYDDFAKSTFCSLRCVQNP